MSKEKIYGNTILISVQSPKGSSMKQELQMNLIFEGDYSLLLHALVDFMQQHQPFAEMIFEAVQRYNVPGQLVLPVDSNEKAASELLPFQDESFNSSLSPSK